MDDGRRVTRGVFKVRGYLTLTTLATGTGVGGCKFIQTGLNLAHLVLRSGFRQSANPLIR